MIQIEISHIKQLNSTFVYFPDSISVKSYG